MRAIPAGSWGFPRGTEGCSQLWDRDRIAYDCLAINPMKETHHVSQVRHRHPRRRLPGRRDAARGAQGHRGSSAPSSSRGWYPIVVALATFVIGSLFIRETKDRRIAE
jgi:hypothetical protein